MPTELQRLEMLDSLLWMSSHNALTALATKHFLNRQFYGISEDERKKAYRTNVANNILYRGNEALIDTSIVEMVEHIKYEDKIAKLTFLPPDFEELRKHRIIVSHPGNVQFSDPKVQKFYDDDLQYKDPKAIRIWKLRDAFLSHLKTLGSNREQSFPNQVVIQSGTIELIHGAISLSLKPGEPQPSWEELWKIVPDYFKKYEEAIRRFAVTSESSIA
jgi:hypothetical protein